MSTLRDRLHDLGDDPARGAPLADPVEVRRRARRVRRGRVLAVGGVAAVTVVALAVGAATLRDGTHRTDGVPVGPATSGTARPSDVPVVLPRPHDDQGLEVCGSAAGALAVPQDVRTVEVTSLLLDDAVAPGTAARTLTSVHVLTDDARVLGVTAALVRDGVVVAAARTGTGAGPDDDLGTGTDALVGAWLPTTVCDDGEGSSAGAALPVGEYGLLTVVDLGTSRWAVLSGTLDVTPEAPAVTTAPADDDAPSWPPLGTMEPVCDRPAPSWPAGSPVRLDVSMPTNGIDASSGTWRLPATVTYTGPGVLTGTARAYSTYWLLRDGVVVGGSELGPGDAGLQRVVLPSGLPVPVDVVLTREAATTQSCGGVPLPDGSYDLTALYPVVDPVVTLPDGSTSRPGPQSTADERVLLTRSDALPIVLAH